MSAREARRMAMIAWRTMDRASHLPRKERSRREPLTAPRRKTPAWSSRSLAERRPLRRITCRRNHW